MAQQKKRKEQGRFFRRYTIEKSLRHHIIEWLATCLTIIGSILNSNLLNIHAFNAFALSFYIWCAGDIVWVLFALKHRHWGVFSTFALLGVINIFAILKTSFGFAFFG